MANPEDALQYLFRARLSRRDMTSLYFRNTARALAFFEHLPHEFLMTVGYDELEVFFVTRTSQGVVGLARDRATKSVNFIWREENFIANAFQVGDSIDVWWFFNALHNKYGFVVDKIPNNNDDDHNQDDDDHSNSDGVDEPDFDRVLGA